MQEADLPHQTIRHIVGSHRPFLPTYGAGEDQQQSDEQRHAVHSIDTPGSEWQQDGPNPATLQVLLARFFSLNIKQHEHPLSISKVLADCGGALLGVDHRDKKSAGVLNRVVAVGRVE